jgi:protein-arginine kinase activator protein McsA
MDGGKMKKMCARCGVIFEAQTNEEKFCSPKCAKLFQESSLGYLKKGHTERKIFAPEM